MSGKDTLINALNKSPENFQDLSILLIGEIRTSVEENRKQAEKSADLINELAKDQKHLRIALREFQTEIKTLRQDTQKELSEFKRESSQEIKAIEKGQEQLRIVITKMVEHNDFYRSRSDILEKKVEQLSERIERDRDINGKEVNFLKNDVATLSAAVTEAKNGQEFARRWLLGVLGTMITTAIIMALQGGK